jgi:hypothetical protein
MLLSFGRAVFEGLGPSYRLELPSFVLLSFARAMFEGSGPSYSLELPSFVLLINQL